MERQKFLLELRATIEKQNLLTKEDKILVGVSGGVDSMTLIQSLFELGYSVAIAHCNFNLRGDESDGDQNFVVDYANAKNIPIHVCSFDTKTVAKERKLSIEMAARELRYEWFDTVCKINQYTKLAIAHNLNDTIETFFINLLRSAGLKGLTGIPMKNGNIVRPLLGFLRKDIEDFAHQSQLRFRVDSSNLENDYMRNKIRNIILPELQKIQPNCFDSIMTSISNLQQAQVIYNQAIDERRLTCCINTQNGFVVDEEKLLLFDNPQTVLFELLHPYGFNSDVVSQIFLSIGSQAGKKFESDNYVVVHDRMKLYVEQKSLDSALQEINISENSGVYEILEKQIQTEILTKDMFVVEKDCRIASLDFDKLKFPLTLRVWKKGDWFIPFGMKGKKKVSDFLIDTKIPLLEKQKVLVLESNGEIVWLVGFRISQNFSVTEKTERIMKIKCN